MKPDSFFAPAYFQEIQERSLASARVVAPLVVHLVRPARVLDVGCGTGAWLSVFRELGASEILGLDGEYVQHRQLLIPVSDFQVVDLARLPDPVRTFDLAVCLEAAQYLDEAPGLRLVEFLVRSAPAVLFSSAVPGQPGAHHVNPQWPAYWHARFQALDFVALDPIRPRIWHDERVALHYRQNVHLYVRRDQLEGASAHSGLGGVERANCLILVDGDTLTANLSWKESLKRIPVQLARRLTRFWKN